MKVSSYCYWFFYTKLGTEMTLKMILALSIIRLHQLRGEIQETPGLLVNSLDKTSSSNPSNEFFLPDFITSINLDYINDALIVKFRRPVQQAKDSSDVQVLLDKNFMRFGRGTGDSSLMRFGKRQSELLDAVPVLQEHESENSARDSRGDNFMRFGKSNDNRMRFGRAVTPLDSSRTVVYDPNYIFRSEHLQAKPMMRLSRGARDFMRFDRNDGRMRFGRSDGFMRLGRTSLSDRITNSQLKVAENTEPYNSRFGRNDKNFMRFGKLDQNFMRFGKRQKLMGEETVESDKSNTSKRNYSNHWDTINDK